MNIPPLNAKLRSELIDHLSQFVIDRRLEVLYGALNQRTRYFTVVLEDIFQPQNASAVLRTCECFGIQDVHVIENQNKFKVDTEVTMGSAKWLTIKKYNSKKNNSKDAIIALKSDGYRIVATSPHTRNTSLHEFDISKGKPAFVFGTELTGISKVIHEHADEFVYIPMYGLTESLNLSVSAAIVIQYLMWKIKNENINYHLQKPDRDDVMYNWLKLTVKSSQLIEKRFLQQKSMQSSNK